jgi:GT2 family glycosyltransferase
VPAVPSLSIVVPTRNRSASVRRLLGRLADDHDASAVVEVIVVDDGSTDGTSTSLPEDPWPFRLRVIQQDNSGAAVARNAGARAAFGDLLLFLDDDVEPEAGLIAAHLRAHAAGGGVVALGDLPPRVSHSTLLGVMLRTWWGEMQAAMRRPGHRYSYRDLLSGHFSMRRADFERLRGFDERLRCREDYELGHRVVLAGMRLQFVPDAVAWHHDSTDVQKAIARKVDEGMADVRLVRRHPPLAPSLPLGRGPAHRGLQGRMMRLAWKDPRAGERAARALLALLPVLERLRLRQRWRGALNGLLSYWYWRGVARSAGSVANLEALLAPARTTPHSPELLDLATGLEHAEARLDTLCPHAVRLAYAAEPIGEVPDLPGAEPLRGRHLRPLIATCFRIEYLRALAAAGVVPPVLAAPAARLTATAARGDASDAATA